MWWKPWTWHRPVEAITSRGAEFTKRDRYMLLALAAVERDTNALGIPLDVATDPKNQFAFITRKPKTDWSVRTFAADQKAFYDAADKAAGEGGVSRAGHLWSIYLKGDEPDE